MVFALSPESSWTLGVHVLANTQAGNKHFPSYDTNNMVFCNWLKCDQQITWGSLCGNLVIKKKERKRMGVGKSALVIQFLGSTFASAVVFAVIHRLLNSERFLGSRNTMKLPMKM
jgi:hypothetical protein